MFMGALPVRCSDDPMTSCNDRCGQGAMSRPAPGSDLHEKLLEQILVNGTRYTCKCDRYCVVYGDCCPDYFTTCGGADSEQMVLDLITRVEEEVAQPQLTKWDQPYLWAAWLYRTHGSCRETPVISDNVYEVHSMWMISYCPESYEDPLYAGEIIHQCHDGARDRLFSYPVSHRWLPQLIYKNVFCAICHDVAVEDIVFWRVIIYCQGKRRGDSGTYWTFQDLLGAADSDLTCPYKSGTVLPASVEFRSCKTHVTSPLSVGSGGVYRTGCQVDDPDLDNDAQAKVRAACRRTFQPVWIPSRQATFSSVHCALCSGIPAGEITPQCRPLSSPPGERRTLPKFAVVDYEMGFLSAEYVDSTNMHGFACSPGVPSDPRSVLLQQCPATPCPMDSRFSHGLQPFELSCSVNRRA